MNDDSKMVLTNNQRCARWRRDNPEKVREIHRRFRERHREEIRQYHKEWRKKNPDRIRAYYKKIKPKPTEPKEHLCLHKRYGKFVITFD